MLRDPQFTELRHFKQREQHRQDLPGLGVTTDHIEPAGRAAHGEHPTDRHHGTSDIEGARNDFMQRGFLGRAQHAIDRRQQLSEGERERRVDGRDVDGLRHPTTWELVPTLLATTLEEIDDLAHLLILEQAAHEFGAGIFPRFLALSPRQEHLRLDAE